MTMKRLGFCAIALLLSASAIATSASEPAATDRVSPIFGVSLPPGYRQWEVVAPAQEAAPLNELRVVLGNPVAMQAYRDGVLPFPDGAILVKLAWKGVRSPEFATASIPGAATTVQVMVKDSQRYAATGGWGFGRFIEGRAADQAQHETCFGCHAALVRAHDVVFTRLAP